MMIRMKLSTEVETKLHQFVSTTNFATSGGVIAFKDGTAVHEYQGKVVIPSEVEFGLKRHYDLGRPLVLNSLRFPLSVIRTFGR